jgi:aerobic-type carbon monoxide dehydrogenase small subunit (CoxS/CutS family)
MRFRINGEVREVNADPSRTLLSLLRDDLDLTGAKYGCGEGQCGACTVLVEGEAVLSCLTRVSSVANKAITTIEGLERDGHLHPLQEAFLKTTAYQCGFCTPGMILRAVALLEEHPRASEPQIKEKLQGSICRCGVYSRIVQAVRMAAQHGA